ncbi:MAG TPA: nucleoside 2-deoxyribosyltransferase domain-containing protein [Gemmataceae bacterium]|nr:nucleoside 2-deoxyribosyltransferase domain-containing protein [Gemmataceae bacterium]
MTRYVEAPGEYDGPGPSLFLAGGITGAFEWQPVVTTALADLPLVILNPRRKNFPIDDSSAAGEQIAWEFRHIRRATAVLFWFPPETLCPIALFELGSRVMVVDQPLFVGTHPDYARRQDVIIQLSLAQPEVRVAAEIPELVRQVRNWFAARSSS